MEVILLAKQKTLIFMHKAERNVDSKLAENKIEKPQNNVQLNLH